MLTSLKKIAWDLDGTLYPSTAGLSAAIQHRLYAVLADKLKVSLEEAKSYFHKQKQRLKSSTLVLDEAGLDGGQFFLDVWTTVPLDEFIDRNEELAELFSQATMVDHLILTNSNTQETVKRKLEYVGLLPTIFSHILTSGEMGATKPERKVFEILLARANVEPQELMYVGDRIDVDLEPAKALGMRTCLISEDTTQAIAPSVDIVCATPNELLQKLLVASVLPDTAWYTTRAWIDTILLLLFPM